METLLARKQLLNELYKLESIEQIWLTVVQKGMVVCLKLFTFDAIKLVQMLPNKTTFYNYEKVSSMA